jgi:sensor histidine kinase YesM
MGRRLDFSIEASDPARLAVLPPFLLQPLVENAVHHGLEGKVGGGSVQVHASVEHGRLEVRIDDDGLGLDEARRSPRAGQGMALANIRARLQTRYGATASLLVTPLDQGTRATLTLPWSAEPNAPSR